MRCWPRIIMVAAAAAILVAAGAALVLAQGTGKDRIAILDFVTIGGAGGEELGAAVSERLRTRTAMGDRYEVVESRMIKQVMTQLGLQASGVFDEGTISEVGRALAARMLVVGSITKIGSTYSINARIINAETLTTMTSADVEGKSEDELNAMIKYLASLINGESPSPARAAVATTPPAGGSPTVTTTVSSTLLSSVFFEAEAASGEYRGDVDIYGQGLSSEGSRLWGQDGRPSPVSISEALERNPVAIPDGQGGRIVIFEIEYTSGEHRGDIDIAAQRISPSGERMWEGGERPVLVASSSQEETHPVAVSDGRGGVIVAYQIEFTEGDYRGDIDVMAQRVSADGDLIWGGGTQSVAVSSATSLLEQYPTIVSDDNSGAIVAFQGEYREGDYKGDIDVFAQRVSADGTRRWKGGDSNVSVASSTEHELTPLLVRDGEGGAVAVFEVHFTSGDYRGDRDIMAQRVSRDGELLWNNGEGTLAVASSTSLERKPRAISDGRGGAIVTYELEYTEGEYRGDIDIGAQRLDSGGDRRWEGGGQSLMVASATSLEQDPILIPDGDGGAIVIFEVEIIEGEYRGDFDVMAQRVSSDGRKLWNNGERSAGVATARSLERHPFGTPDGTGGAIIFFESEYVEGEYEGDIDIKAQRINGSGDMVWNSGEFSSLISALNDWYERHPVASQ